MLNKVSHLSNFETKFEGKKVFLSHVFHKSHYIFAPANNILPSGNFLKKEGL